MLKVAEFVTLTVLREIGPKCVLISINLTVLRHKYSKLECLITYLFIIGNKLFRVSEINIR